jgi:hypothetical protein
MLFAPIYMNHAARRAVVEKESKGMKCPHCQVEYVEAAHTFALGEDPDGGWHIREQRCPTCDRIIVSLGCSDGRLFPVMPQGSHRPRPSDDVPREYATEYRTATEVLPYSIESSAALSRRLLHRVLDETAKLGNGALSEQIRQGKYSATFPAYLKDALEAYARIAKLETIPVKSQTPSALVKVEPGEAEWTLDLLESLFEYYYIFPASLRRRQEACEALVQKAAPMEPSAAEPAAAELPAEQLEQATAAAAPAAEPAPAG